MARGSTVFMCGSHSPSEETHITCEATQAEVLLLNARQRRGGAEQYGKIRSRAEYPRSDVWSGRSNKATSDHCATNSRGFGSEAASREVNPRAGRPGGAWHRRGTSRGTAASPDHRDRCQDSASRVR